jgi:ABC-2 type transport system ATP-binding protein
MDTDQTSGDDLLCIENLNKNYGEFQAVADLSFSVNRGEIFALLGPNGAGKTTTIRMLMGILQPTSGSVRIGGLDCFQDRAEIMTRVGYMPDDPVFYDYLRGSEIIRFCGELHGLAPEVVEAESAELIGRLGLEGDLEEFATNYSKGMKKKLAAVLAFLHAPSLVILDEPTNGLDPHATRTFHELVLDRVRRGTTVFFSTHLLDQAEKLCTRVGILFKGRLAAIGNLDELRRSAPNQSLEEIFFQVTAPSPTPGDDA